MPATAARPISTRSFKLIVCFSLEFIPARRKAVPHIGPLVPPALPANAEPTFIKNFPIDERSISVSSWRKTARKPSARVLPKSASPISPSKSQKNFSLSNATFATVRRQPSTVSKPRELIPGGIIAGDRPLERPFLEFRLETRVQTARSALSQTVDLACIVAKRSDVWVR